MSMTVQTCDYSTIGRNLTEADIGKQVLRVAPYRNKDASNCFQKGAKLEAVALKFEGILNNNLHFSYVKDGRKTERFVSANWNDGAWTTVDELMKKLQKNK